MKYLAPPLLSSLLFFFLGFFILSKNKKSETNFKFFLLCITTFIWQFSWFILFSFPHEKLIQFLFKIGYTGIIFLPIVYYDFLLSFLKIKNKIILLFYLIGTTLTIFTWTTDLFIRGGYKYFWGNYPKAGILHPIYLLLLAFLAFHGAILLIKGKKNALDIKTYNQIKYILLSLLFFIPSSLDFLINYGIGYYPFGFIFILISLSIVAYAIVRHQLMDIEVIIKRTLVFAGLFAAVYAIVAGIAFIGQAFFEQILGVSRWVSLIPSVAIVVLVLKPLENFLINTTDKYLFQKKYDYRELLKAFSREVLTVLDVKQIARLTVEKVIDIIRVESAIFYAFNKDNSSFVPLSYKGNIPNPKLILDNQNPITAFILGTQEYLQKDKTFLNDPEINSLFKSLNVQLIIPMILQNQSKGLLILGPKKSGEEYTQEDIDILLSLAQAEAISLSNAELLDELSKTQAEAAQKEKMAVIGTLSAGINHEICNPLGIARGQCEAFLLNYRDGLYKDKNPQELFEKTLEIMQKTIKEVDRATAVTKRLSTFAKPSKEFKPERVKIMEELGEVFALLQHDLTMEKIDFEKEIEPNIPDILADKKQFDEIIFNLVRNAAQAIGEKGRIIFRAKNANNGFITIEIEDTGCGIPEDKMDKIFNPFFTTKAPGKGTGLGLFIVKQVVERNSGKISFRSKVGEGTTFILEFPAILEVSTGDKK